jgi:2-polyprenyl-6-methoxyphenol hydroxylase-like FAD-dependent oxidoreductase
LHAVLLQAVCDRLGADAVRLGRRVTGFTQDDKAATLLTEGGGAVTASLVVGCDGIHSAIRRQLYPEEGPPRYSGINMWRGVTAGPPFFTGASMVRVGWLATGKLVVYPIRNYIDSRGSQLLNWVAELETPEHVARDWNRRGRLSDFAYAFANWHFDWLDVPAMLEATEQVLEYPMVDQDPLPRWTFGRVTLLGDAAHPMVPRGSNGAGQAILDARSLADSLVAHPGDPAAALRAYESQRREATARVVLTNRTNPPDALLREVYLRTNDQPFASIDDVLTPAEIVQISDGYKTIAGFSRDALAENR